MRQPRRRPNKQRNIAAKLTSADGMQAEATPNSEVIYSDRCTETMLPKENFVATMAFLFKTADDDAKAKLFRYATAVYDSWTDCNGDERTWRILWSQVESWELGVEEQRLTLEHLGALADKVEYHLEMLQRLNIKL